MSSKVQAERQGVRRLWLAPLLVALMIHMARPPMPAVAEPDKLLAANAPVAATTLQKLDNASLPNQGLSLTQSPALITYIEVQGGSMRAMPAGASTQVLPAGNPDNGRALFMGDVHFRNAGPPCIGCHSIGKAGALGGGVLGPDLTQIATRQSDVRLASDLADISWPTMAPIFARHPLTQQEQADLLAFLLAASGEQQTNREVLVLALSLAGLLGALFAIGIVWRRRLQGVRRLLVERARTGKDL